MQTIESDALIHSIFKLVSQKIGKQIKYYVTSRLRIQLSLLNIQLVTRNKKPKLTLKVKRQEITRINH